MQYFVPFTQVPPPPGASGGGPGIQGILLRANVGPDVLADPIRRIVVEGRTNLPFLHVRRYAELLEQQMRPWRQGTLLLSLFELLVASDDRQRLASPAFTPDPKAFMSHAINNVLAHIAANLGDELREPMLAERVGQSPSAFSRSFRKHTGQSFVRYVNRLRIGRACELLANSDKPVLDVCMDVGFNNVSNFNRQFLLHKRMPPTKFRHFHRMQLAASRAANSPP